MSVKHIFKITDLSTKEIMEILHDAKLFSVEKKDWQFSRSTLVANLFFEPSTRTHYSFASAQHQLGCKVEHFQAESSSVKKGESLYDTVKTFACIGFNALVIRHREEEYFKQLQKIQIPIINAGDGKGNHPTQCLLDLYTIYEEFQTLSNLKIAIIGDVYHSRVAHSFAQAMQLFQSQVVYSGPRELMDSLENYEDIETAISTSDVVMFLRVQRERHHNTTIATDDSYLQMYGLTKKRYELLKPNAIVMHPAPVNRGVEIDDCLVEAKKSRIFQQMENGVYVRKSVLKYVLGGEF